MAGDEPELECCDCEWCDCDCWGLSEWCCVTAARGKREGGSWVVAGVVGLVEVALSMVVFRMWRGN